LLAVDASVTISVRDALRAHFKSPEWAVLDEVSNGTGYARGNKRFIDVLAMNLWPSRGLEIHGVEIKISRSDWLREKKDPKKADDVAKYCDRWWLCVGGDDIAKEEEVPRGWGFMVVRKDKIAVVRDAPEQKRKAKLDRLFVAAMLRRASESVDALRNQPVQPEMIAQAVEDAVAFRKVTWEVDAQQELQRTKFAHEQLLAQMGFIEEATGVKIWNMSYDVRTKLIELFKVANVQSRLEELQRSAKYALSNQASVEGAFKALDEALGKLLKP